jgi:hypothetical protein
MGGGGVDQLSKSSFGFFLEGRLFAFVSLFFYGTQGQKMLDNRFLTNLAKTLKPIV